uniref:hypothetical protein n=1 Tax=Flavobacterium sp. TaxID=239 RepID=UPI00404B05C1
MLERVSCSVYVSYTGVTIISATDVSKVHLNITNMVSYHFIVLVYVAETCLSFMYCNGCFF